MKRSRVSDSSKRREWISRIVLVSGSPRRRELLDQLGVSYSVWIPGVDESVDGDQRPAAYVRRIAQRKITAYMERNEFGSAERRTVADPLTTEAGSSGPMGRDWALAADTVVALGNRIIGKPSDRSEAEAVLRSLSGRTHRVITALALFNPHKDAAIVKTATTRVVFEDLSEEEIEWYLRSEEWRDVAGGYRIQERGSVLVRKIVGSYSNVVGLPLETFYGMVLAQGFHLFPSGE